MAAADIDFITRLSLSADRVSVISRHMRESLNPQPTDHRNWSWGYLRHQFISKGLEDLYLQYQQRLQTGFFSVFFVLQMLLNTIHIIVLLVGIQQTSVDAMEVLPDIVVYTALMAMFWPMVILIVRERILKDYPWLPLFVSCMAMLLLVCSDLGLPLYHKSVELTGESPKPHVKVRPAYAAHTLLACYVFLPVTYNLQAIILGVTVTMCHLFLLGTVVYIDEPRWYIRLTADAIYLSCLNALGLYHRYMNEVTVRRTFLDRRDCIKSTYNLKYERQQEEQLLLSILPTHIVDVVKKDLRKVFQTLESNAPPVRKKPFTDMYVKEHQNVSILYADVVNYTKLTVSLPVQKLVETLNELFGRFDEASEAHNVLRIKFLGDCYYCVAGVPDSSRQHASNCVNLGLEMIDIIKNVREVRNLRQGLDMRIGIHSGNILSGILGLSKWQYDIWSKDVVIANVMEQTGQAGKVHVTQQTVDELGDQFNLIPADGELRSNLLAKYKIKTYFIVPKVANTTSVEEAAPLVVNGKILQSDVVSNYMHEMVSHLELENTPQRTPYNRRISSANINRKITNRNQAQVSIRRNTNDNIAVEARRTTVFMDNNLYQYKQALKVTDIQMEKAIKKMRYGVHERWLRRNKTPHQGEDEEGINPACLTFDKFSWELPFLQQADPLFKFYVSSAFIVALSMLAIQGLNMPSSHRLTWIGFGTLCGSLFLFMPFLWTFFLWNARSVYEDEYPMIPEPRNTVLKLLYRTSQEIVCSLPARTCIYLTVCVALGTCSLLELIDCDTIQSRVQVNNTSFSSHLVNEIPACVPAWQISESCSLAIIMSFFFLKIHFLLQLLVGLVFVGLYICCVIIFLPEIFQNSETWNPTLQPQVAHIMSALFLLVTLHLLDRQSEYMMRLDYKWKQQLQREEEDATLTRTVNKMLLENILPVHVAKIYLNTDRLHDELYHEEYESVAVMFASLTDYDINDDENPNEATEKTSLTLLNQIICDFDKILFKDDFRRIEKIKVAGQTYMAACGLVTGRRDSSTSYARVNFEENPVVVLARFAAKMIKVLKNYNRETFQEFKLRIGISHGPVTAGVVGSQKPLYDIWGDAVNMASRMDTTGEPDKLQVTKNTAEVLMNEGTKCTYRGKTFIKGKRVFVDTYFVTIDSRFKLVKFTEEESQLYAELCQSHVSDRGDVITEVDESEEELLEETPDDDHNIDEVRESAYDEDKYEEDSSIEGSETFEVKRFSGDVLKEIVAQEKLGVINEVKWTEEYDAARRDSSLEGSETFEVEQFPGDVLKEIVAQEKLGVINEVKWTEEYDAARRDSSLEGSETFEVEQFPGDELKEIVAQEKLEVINEVNWTEEYDAARRETNSVNGDRNNNFYGCETASESGDDDDDVNGETWL